MSDTKDPTNAELLTALQGMWRQQKDLVQGLEGRLGVKLEGVARDVEERVDARLRATEERVDAKLQATEERLGERLAREIQDRPVVDLEERGRAH